MTEQDPAKSHRHRHFLFNNAFEHTPFKLNFILCICCVRVRNAVAFILELYGDRLWQLKMQVSVIINK